VRYPEGDPSGYIVLKTHSGVFRTVTGTSRRNIGNRASTELLLVSLLSELYVGSKHAKVCLKDFLMQIPSRYGTTSKHPLNFTLPPPPSMSLYDDHSRGIVTRRTGEVPEERRVGLYEIISDALETARALEALLPLFEEPFSPPSVTRDSSSSSQHVGDDEL
jgi:hypothetical protein